jgi:hypothetical protein
MLGTDIEAVPRAVAVLRVNGSHRRDAVAAPVIHPAVLVAQQPGSVRPEMPQAFHGRQVLHAIEQRGPRTGPL